MAKVFQKGGPAELALLAQVIQRYHPELLSSGCVVDIDIVRKFSSDSEPVRCLNHHGNPAAAVIRLTPVSKKNRVEFDALILLDGFVWDSVSEATKIALLDHELTHLEPAKNKAEQLKKDDLNRQVMRMKRDDFAITGFIDIVRKHGKAALELHSVKNVSNEVQAALDYYVAQNPPPSVTV